MEDEKSEWFEIFIQFSVVIFVCAIGALLIVSVAKTVGIVE